MTTYNTLLPRSAFIGFDRLFDELERSFDRRPNTYPPYNLVKVDDEHFRIELAVAGFSENDIDITLNNGTLTIKSTNGNKEECQSDCGCYIHRGIAKRHFQREFTLAEYVEVESADIQNGVLVVNLVKNIPEEKKPKKIQIGSKSQLLNE